MSEYDRGVEERRRERIKGARAQAAAFALGLISGAIGGIVGVGFAEIGYLPGLGLTIGLVAFFLGICLAVMARSD